MLYAPACILLAAKVEETPGIWPKHILEQWAKVISKKLLENIDKDAVLVAECNLLTELNDSLLMHHPYRPLQIFLSDATAEKECTSNAWHMANDSFIFDVGLTHPPYIIALACMYMSSVMVDKDLQHWYTNSYAKTAQIHEVMQEMLKGYDLMGSERFEQLKKVDAGHVSRIELDGSQEDTSRGVFVPLSVIKCCSRWRSEAGWGRDVCEVK